MGAEDSKIGRVYLITNRVNGARYVGFTTRSIQQRWKEHVTARGSRKIHSAVIEFGETAFIVELLYEGDYLEALRLERFFIRKFKAISAGYNLKHGGQAGFLGKRHSVESRAKLSAAAMGHKRWVGRHHSADAKEKIRAARIGRTATSETKAKMSASGTGRKFSPEHRRKISLNNVGMSGRKHSLETRLKMSAAHGGGSG